MAVTRYTDIDIATAGAKDFVIRRRAPTVTQLLVIFISVLLVSISITLSTIDRLALVSVLFILLGAVGWYVTVQLLRSRDLVLTTEFQNALFASALGIDNKFCIIIKRDGNIVYLDRSFQEMFPDFLKEPRRTVDTLLVQGKVAQQEREKIFAAIERGVFEKIIFDIRSSDGKMYKIVMSIEPILRPSGFILMRGREFIEQRTASNVPTSTLLNKSNIGLFSYVMDTMNLGVYMTDPAGSIIYANPILEQWLGFQEGELASGTLMLQDIVQQSGRPGEHVEPGDYEGNTVLRKKVGGSVNGFINQKLIRTHEGKIMGCTALVHNVASQQAESKKKLW